MLHQEAAQLLAVNEANTVTLMLQAAAVHSHPAPTPSGFFSRAFVVTTGDVSAGRSSC